MSKNVPKIAFLGLDGVGKSFLRSIIEQFNLKYMKEFMKNIVELKAIPPYTPLAWTSIFSGVNPGKHGIFGFFKPKFNDYGRIVDFEVNTSKDIAAPRIFEIANAHGLRSILMNVPFTYPVHYIHGYRNMIIVSDWTSPIQMIFPKSIDSRLRGDPRYRKYVGMNPPSEWYEASSVKVYMNMLKTYVEGRLAIYYRLLEEYEWNCLFIVFSVFDWMLHHVRFRKLWLFDENIHGYVLEILRAIDRFMGFVIKNSDIVFVGSDHNFSRKTIAFRVYNFLEKMGLINLGFPFKVYYQLKTNLGPNILRRILSIVKRTGKALKWEGSKRRGSLVMFVEPTSLGLYIQRGEEYDAIKKSIINKGNRFPFVKFFTNDILYWGPHVGNAPDIIIIPREFVQLGTWGLTTYGRVSTLNHGYNAIFSYVAHSTELRKKMECLPLNEMTIYDATPIMLYVMNLFAPYYFDTSRSIAKKIMSQLDAESLDKNIYQLKRLLKIFRITKRKH